MRLRELQPKLLKLTDPNGGSFKTNLRKMERADGVMFLCPKCFVENKGPRGTHFVLCWKPSVAPHIDPKPGRWEMVGTSLDDVTLVAGSSSVQILGGCNAHFFIRGGSIEMA